MPERSSPAVIVFEDVTFRYRPDARPALCDVSLTVAPAEFVAVVGANGSGKSTLARLCDGLLIPSAGRVTVDDLDTAREEHIWDVRSRVGMVFQDPDDQIVGTVVEEDCAFGPENLGLPPDEIVARVAASLSTVGLAGLERREPHLLSEGQKQRLAIAGALAMRPRYLVFDEATAMLDPAGRRSAMTAIGALSRDEGHGVVFVSHETADVVLADRVIALVDGRVAFDGPPAELVSDPVLLADCGMAIGPAGMLADRLRSRGLPVPITALSAESVVGALWP
jgi:energy-coupling factor transport system ATP-binding protein